MMLVRDRMSSSPVVVAPDATVATIAHALEQHAISAVPVVEGERMVGIVSTTDIVRALAGPRDTPIDARSLMSAPVVVARPTDRLDEVARRLVAEHHDLVCVAQKCEARAHAAPDASRDDGPTKCLAGKCENGACIGNRR